MEQSPGATRIAINATNNDDLLTLTVKDIGSNRVNAKEIKKGTGLSNSEERLYKLYGRKATLSILPFVSQGYSGMEVIIKIPLQYAAV